MDHAPPQVPATEAGGRAPALIAWSVTLTLVILIGILQFLGGKANLEPELNEEGDTIQAVAPGAMFQVMAKYAVFASNFAGEGSDGALHDESEPTEPAIEDAQPEVADSDEPAPGESPDQETTADDPEDEASQDELIESAELDEAAGSSIGMQVLAPVQQMAVTQLDRLRVAVLAAEVVGVDRALSMIDRVAEEETSTEGLVEDVELLRRIYAGELLEQAERERLVERHAWFGDLALMYGTPRSDPERQRVESEAGRIGTIVIGVVIVVAGIGIAGLGLFVTALIMSLTGHLKTSFKPPAPGGSIGVEIFALFLVSFILVQVVSVLLVSQFGEATAIIGSILTWALLLVPLWALVRGVSLKETQMLLGWHGGKGPFREIGAGIVGYLAGLPIVGIGIGLVFVMSAIWQFFAGEEAPPPAHPLVDQVGAGGVGVAIYLVLMMTVWAPVVEETMFRGALYAQLRSRLNAVISALITGFIFAAIHPQSVLAIPTLMSLAFVFAMLREWRGSIIAPMVAHALNNGMIAIMLLFLFAG